jgi:hypothetical protein
MRQSGGLACVLALIGGAALAAPEAAELGKAIGMTIAEGGTVENMCGEVVETTVTPIDFGGAVGIAHLLLIPGGPDTLTCYGDVPGDMYMFVAETGGFRQVFAGGGYIMVLPSVHDGVHDFALGGPGFAFPRYVWNGTEFEAKGEISDQDLAALGAIPIYPQ